AVHVVGTDIGNGRHLHVIGGQGADQYAPFVAGADKADAHWVIELRVLVVHRPQPRAGNDAGGQRAHQKFTARQLAANGRVKVIFADGFFFGSQVHGIRSLVWILDRG